MRDPQQFHFHSDNDDEIKSVVKSIELELSVDQMTKLLLEAQDQFSTDVIIEFLCNRPDVEKVIEKWIREDKE